MFFKTLSLDKKSFLLLFLIFVFHLSANSIWFKQAKILKYVDITRHLKGEIDFKIKFDTFLEKENSTLTDFLTLFSDKKDEHYPKFVYFLTTIFSKIFGHSLFKILMYNQLYFLLIIIFTFLIAKEIHSTSAGIVAAYAISFFPGIWGVSRAYILDFPLIAFVTMGYFFLLKTDKFRNLKYSLILGLVSGIGFLTKPVFPIFVIIPIIYSFISDRFNFQRVRNLLFFLGLGLFVSSPYWFFSLKYLLHHLVIRSYFLRNEPLYDGGVSVFEFFNRKSGYIKPFSDLWFLAYPLYILRYLSPLFLVVFLFSVKTFLKSEKKTEKVLLFMWILIPLFFLMWIVAKWPRYYFPALPAFAVIIGIGIAEMKKQVFKKLLLGFLILFTLHGFLILSFARNPDFYSEKLIRALYFPKILKGLQLGESETGEFSIYQTSANEKTADYFRFVDELAKQIEKNSSNRKDSGKIAIISALLPMEIRDDSTSFLIYLLKMNNISNKIVSNIYVKELYDESINYFLIIQPHPMNLKSFSLSTAFGLLDSPDSIKNRDVMSHVSMTISENFILHKSYLLEVLWPIENSEIHVYLFKKRK